MRALILDAPMSLSYREVPVPVPGDGELLIRVRATTTCGTDLKAYRRGHPQIPMPGGLGHEYSGVVVATGSGARFAVGDAVMGVHSAPCQECFWCRHDQENLCESIMATKVLGSYAEYLLIPERIARLNVFAKPDSISYDNAALLEPLSCVAQAVALLPLREDTRALIIGPGAIGLMFVAALKQLGIPEIVLAGRNASRLKIGAEFGAATVSYAEYEGRDFDVVIECTGQPEVWERSVNFARRGGTVMLFGGCPGGTTVTFDTKRLHYDQINLVSPFHFGTKAVRQAREWLLNDMDLSPLITAERSLADAVEVFDDLYAGRGLKYVFRP